MYLVGITGPIATGKSVVAKLYEEMGAYLLDADKIGHELLESRGIKRKIIETFGREILDEKGKIDREKLGKIVFEDSGKLDELNNIMEKPLTSKIRNDIIELEESGFPGIVVIDAALLPKWELIDAMNLIVLVETPKWQRINRLVRQLGYSQDDAECRIDVQEKIFKNFHPQHSIIVKNNGDFFEVKTNAMKAWLKIKEKSKAEYL
ncbi:dephospho-CoA kinase [bacterium]|nr:dephospho-CoA kinase [bacterium]